MNKVKQLVCEKDDDLSKAIFSLDQGKVLEISRKQEIELLSKFLH